MPVVVKEAIETELERLARQQDRTAEALLRTQIKLAEVEDRARAAERLAIKAQKLMYRLNSVGTS